MNGKALTSLFFLIVAVGFLTVFAFVVYSIAQGVGKATQKKMEKKNVVFSRDGMKVRVKEVSEERELDKSRRCVDPNNVRLASKVANYPVPW